MPRPVTEAPNTLGGRIPPLRTLTSVFCVLVCTCALDPILGAQTASTQSTAPRIEEAPPVSGRALLIGVSKYPKLRERLLAREAPNSELRELDLQGPPQNVARMQAALEEALGFPPDRVRSLLSDTDDEPTRDNILAALTQLATDAQPGELVVIYYSGHGSQIPDRDGDERGVGGIDGLDEVLLPQDTDQWDRERRLVVGGIVDDELSEKLDAILDRGARVWVILDSCFSGTALRGDSEGTPLKLSDAILGMPENFRELARRDPDKHLLRNRPGLIGFCAAASNHEALEVPFPGESKRRGLYTDHLTKALVRLRADVSFAELHRAVATRMSIEHPGHPPYVQGDLFRVIASGRSARSVYTIVERQGRWVLDAGDLHGMATDTELNVFAPGRAGIADAAIGIAKIFRVGMRESEVTFTPPAGHAVEPGDLLRVTLRKLVARNGKVRVRLTDHQGVALTMDSLDERVRGVLTGEPQPSTDDPSALTLPRKNPGQETPRESSGPAALAEYVTHGPADWQLAISADGTFELRSVADESRIVRKGTLDQLEPAIFGAFRTKNLLDLAQTWPDAELPRGLSAVFQVQQGEKIGRGKWSRYDGSILEPPSRIRLKVINSGLQSWNVWAFLLFSDLRAAVLYPSDRNDSALIVGEVDGHPVEDSSSAFRINDETVGIEHALILALPASADQDLSSLADGSRQDDLRSARQDSEPLGLARALCDMASKTPGKATSVLRSSHGAFPDGGGMTLVSYEVGWRNAVARRSAIKVGPSWTHRALPESHKVREFLTSSESDELTRPVAPPPPGPWSASRSTTSFEHSKLGVLHIEDEESAALIVEFKNVSATDEVQPLRMALYTSPARRAVYYDRDGDGEFDLVVVDHDADPSADTRFTWDGTLWQIDREAHGPWLQLSLLGFWSEEDLDTKKRRWDQAALLQQFLSD